MCLPGLESTVFIKLPQKEDLPPLPPLLDFLLGLRGVGDCAEPYFWYIEGPFELEPEVLERGVLDGV